MPFFSLLRLILVRESRSSCRSHSERRVANGCPEPECRLRLCQLSWRQTPSAFLRVMRPKQTQQLPGTEAVKIRFDESSDLHMLLCSAVCPLSSTDPTQKQCQIQRLKVLSVTINGQILAPTELLPFLLVSARSIGWSFRAARGFGARQLACLSANVPTVSPRC